MKAANMIAMVKRFTDQYGVNVSWNEQTVTNNSRGRPIASNDGMIKSSKVLLLKDKFDPNKVIDTNVFGLSADYSRYILALPEVDIKKDMIITDNHDMKWKLGIIDWFDVGGVPVCKQSALTEVQ